MLLDLLAKNEVDVITKMTIQEIMDGGVLSIDKDLNKTVIEYETVVLAVRQKPPNELYNSIDGHYLRSNKAVDGTILNFYVKKRELIDRFKYCKSIQA
ncbi:MAG: hypothetical protein MOIL_01003 [Candidatus Methanolliviera sp. GoM_oil]|nr:MAG: hypothetical protein MOIL_01003 [Candidatus Methanolliviera sp. GoM_oil]